MTLSRAKPSSIATRISKDGFFRMGWLHHSSGDLHSAAECYIRSIQNGPNAEAHTFLGWVLGMMGNLDHAIEECKKALQLDPDFGNAWNDIGGYLMEKREFERAIPYLKRACKSKNYDAPEFPHYNLGRIYVHKGMLLAARRELARALKRNANFDPARRLLFQIDRQIH